MGPDEGKARLIAAASTLLARDGEKFSIVSVCAEAGMTRADFHAHFAGKAALLAALSERQPAPEGRPEPPATDVWLERRLRVFERALNALESQAEANTRAHAVAVARLEERVAAIAAPIAEAAVVPVAEAAPEPAPRPAPLAVAEQKPVPDMPRLAPASFAAVSREEMSAALQSARNKMVIVEAPRPRKRKIAYPRCTAIGALSLMTLLLGIGVTLGGAAQASGQGVARRHAVNGLARLQAQADSGDAHAQAQVAVMYLRAGDLARAARWSAASPKAASPWRNICRAR